MGCVDWTRDWSCTHRQLFRCYIAFSFGVIAILGGVYGLASSEIEGGHSHAHGVAVKLIDTDEETRNSELDIAKEAGVSLKPGTEKDGAFGPSSDGKPDELDQLVNPPSPSKR